MSNTKIKIFAFASDNLPPLIKKSQLPLLVILVFSLEILIYLWALLTTEPEFIFDKCARNSGRVSSTINLVILLMISYCGFREIYREEIKKDIFRILLVLFTVNHLCHFSYVFQNFKHHTLELSLLENLHGFITFICIIIAPIIVWIRRDFHPLFYILLTLHLFNVSYFIMKTFSSKITTEKPAYHNQLGIAVTSLAMLYVVYRFFLEYKSVNPKKKAI